MPLRSWPRHDSIKPARLFGGDGIGGAEFRAGAVNLPSQRSPNIAREIRGVLELINQVRRRWPAQLYLGDANGQLRRNLGHGPVRILG